MVTLSERSDPGAKETKNIFTKFNELGYKLTHYQIMRVYEWFSTIDNIKLSLQSPLLYKEQDTEYSEGIIYPNLDPRIFELVREAKVMERNNVEILYSAKIILLQEEKFKK